MAVAPFEQICASCHIDQITGKERVSGPKGVAFLSLPGLDLETLRKRKAEIGEWPVASEAELTPFMKVIISRNERGRALIKVVDGLNLQDLSKANNKQIIAVTNLVWEIKALFYAMIAGKAPNVFADLDIGGGAKLSPSLVADLTASIPRDVVINAHQEWLPNLATEMVNRPHTNNPDQGGWGASVTETKLSASVSPAEVSRSEARQAAPKLSPQNMRSEAAGLVETIRFAQINQQTQSKNATGGVANSLRIDPSGNISDAPGNESEAARLERAAGKSDTANAKPGGGKETPPAAGQPPLQNKAADQTDDLLFPTEEELRVTGKPDTARAKPDGGGTEAASREEASSSAANSPSPSAAAPGAFNAMAAGPQTKAAAVIDIQSDVDPESWAAYGGWYQQDHAIFYRPTGHKDKFFYSWLFLTVPQAPRDGKTPAAATFDYLTAKDAQGSCTKCHSIDDIEGSGRLVHFSPVKAAMKQGRFTNFIHEPHFSVLENRSCLTCHDLEKSRSYLKSYQQGDPQNFVSNFSAVKKELCQTCHTSSAARQDCMLCHKYHINGIVTPTIDTQLPHP